jgi:hypothetical protein
MSLTLGSRPQHLDDADLVRYLDRQLDRAGNRRTELHLSACAECSARLKAMDARSSQVSAWLGGLDAPASDEQKALAMAAVQRARFRARPFAAVSRPLAAAAMIALMLTVTFGTPPGRAWVNGAVQRLGRIFPGEAEQAPTASRQAAGSTVAADSVAAAAEAEPSGAAAPTTGVPRGRGRAVLPPGMSEAVSFNPPGNYVLIRFDSRQRDGAALLWSKDISTASGQVVAGRQAERLVPTADGLRIRNAPGSRADYVIEVPKRYRYIRVQVADEPETTYSVPRSQHDMNLNVMLSGSGN